MKRLTVSSLFLLLVTISLGFSQPIVHQPRFNHQPNRQLGIEITTNSCSQTLYLPVGMTREKGLVATVPVQGGGAVSAVRIAPVMEKGKVKFDVLLVSGNYSETISGNELRRLLAVQVSTRVAAKGETLIVRDEASDAPWSVTIKAVDLRQDSANSLKNPQFLKASTRQDLELEGNCGCAYCHDLRVCPNRGQCINTTCGSICCPYG